MRRIIVAALLAVSVVGTADAQEMTGAKAEEVKKEISNWKRRRFQS
jgi:hypothetical protein